MASAENGVIRVLSEKDCIVTETEKRLTASRKQSCGKCVFCRERSVATAVYAKRSKRWKGKAEFIDMTKEIGEAMTYSTPCSMGQNSSRIALTAVEKLQESMRHISRRKTVLQVYVSQRKPSTLIRSYATAVENVWMFVRKTASKENPVIFI